MMIDQPPGAETLRLLLIEDNPGDARLVELRLEEALEDAFRLEHAETLQQGLDRLQQARPDLVLLDLDLPDAEGLDAVQSVRSADGRQPVVVLTGLDDEGVALDALREGAQDYLVKDELDSSSLERSIRYSLERHRAALELHRTRREAEKQREFSRAILRSLPQHIAVLDEDGTIRSVNTAWRAFAAEEGGDPRGYEGENYLEVTEAAAEEDEHARRMLDGLGAVLSGDAASFLLDYPCHSPTEKRWFRVSVTPLAGEVETGAVVSHIDITGRIRTESRLRERVKEQSCLYDVSRHLHGSERALEDRLQRVVERIPDGWQYPEVTAVRLTIDGTTYTSERFAETGRRLRAPVAVRGEEVGGIEVHYLEPRPQEDIGPFLTEERRLLDEIAGRIGDEIARMEGLEERGRLAGIVQSTSDFVGMSTPEGKTLWVNRPGRRMLGIPEDEDLMGVPIASYCSDAAARKIEEEGIPVAREEGSWMGETALVTRDGEEIPVSQVIVAHRTDDGEISHLSTIARDISDLKEAESALRERETLYRTLVETAAEGILLTDRAGNFTYANPGAQEMLGLEEPEISSRSYRHPEWGICAPDGGPFPDRQLPVAQVLRSGEAVADVEHGVRRPDGRRLVLSVNAAPLTDEKGEVTGVVATLRDVTEQKELQRQLRHQAFHDPLTGLPNRTLFQDRLEQAVARGRRRSSHLGLLMIDLQRFKRINESLGHTAGDRVLEETARRLEGAVREEDTVARWGGDEFVCLLEDVEDEEGLRAVYERLARSVGEPLEVAGESLHLEMAVGGIHSRHLVPLSADDVGDLMRYADLALRGSKTSPGRSFELFRPEAGKGDVPSTWLKREQDLRRGLEGDEFEPFYQPIVGLASGEVWGIEPLARWRHPERGLVGPGEFIGLAEESGLIHELGRTILVQACERVARWVREGRGHDDLRLTPNVSGRQFEAEGFIDHLDRILDASSLAPERTAVEVTETSIMRASHRIDELRELGVRVLVDDFGTGYSSLLYVRDLEVDGLKIDMRFVHGMAESVSDAAIVETILTLGEHLGLDVVAEGIETEEQHQRLRSMGCEIGQGFHFARPMPADEMSRWLAEG